MRHATVAVLIAAGVLAAGCSESSVPTQSDRTAPPPQFVKKSSRIVIDGTMSKGEWGGAAALQFVTSAQEGLVPATLFASIDATNLYLAIRIQRPADTNDVFVAFQFDTDDDDVPFESGDDMIFVEGVGGSSSFSDAFRVGTGSSHDELAGGTVDGAGAVGGDNTATIVEIRHPLNSGDTGHDIAITSLAPEVGITFEVRLAFAGAPSAQTPGENTVTVVPSPGFMCKLDIGPPLSVGSCPSGRIASVRIVPNVGDVFIIPLFLGQGLSRQLGFTTFDYLGTDVTSVTSCAWGSEDNSIATVSSTAVVTGIALGTTVIHNACQTSTPVSPFGSEGQLRVDVIP